MLALYAGDRHTDALQRGYDVTVADTNVHAAQALIDAVPHDKMQSLSAVALNVTDPAAASAVDALVSKHDCVLSLLPATLHPAIAPAVIKNKKHLVTASYICTTAVCLVRAANPSVTQHRR